MVIVLILVTVSTIGCNTGNDNQEQEQKLEYEVLKENDDIFKPIPSEYKEKNKHEEIVDEFSSEISVCYKNEDDTVY